MYKKKEVPTQSIGTRIRFSPSIEMTRTIECERLLEVG